MKKLFAALLAFGSLMLAGCGNTVERETITAETTAIETEREDSFEEMEQPPPNVIPSDIFEMIEVAWPQQAPKEYRPKAEILPLVSETWRRQIRPITGEQDRFVNTMR